MYKYIDGYIHIIFIDINMYMHMCMCVNGYRCICVCTHMCARWLFASVYVYMQTYTYV